MPIGDILNTITKFLADRHAAAYKSTQQPGDFDAPRPFAVAPGGKLEGLGSALNYLGSLNYAGQVNPFEEDEVKALRRNPPPRRPAPAVGPKTPAVNPGDVLQPMNSTAAALASKPSSKEPLQRMQPADVLATLLAAEPDGGANLLQPETALANRRTVTGNAPAADVSGVNFGAPSKARSTFEKITDALPLLLSLGAIGFAPRGSGQDRLATAIFNLEQGTEKGKLMQKLLAGENITADDIRFTGDPTNILSTVEQLNTAKTNAQISAARQQSYQQSVDQQLEVAKLGQEGADRRKKDEIEAANLRNERSIAARREDIASGERKAEAKLQAEKVKQAQTNVQKSLQAIASNKKGADKTALNDALYSAAAEYKDLTGKYPAGKRTITVNPKGMFNEHNVSVDIGTWMLWRDLKSSGRSDGDIYSILKAEGLLTEKK